LLSFLLLHFSLFKRRKSLGSKGETMKSLTAVVFVLLFASSAQAWPSKKTMNKIAEILIDHVLPGATALMATNATHNCRRAIGLGNGCPDGGYGAYAAREGLRGGFSIGMGEISHGCYAQAVNNKDRMSCFIFAAVPIAWNTFDTVKADVYFCKAAPLPHCKY
jgi:hypothetical protein